MMRRRAAHARSTAQGMLVRQAALALRALDWAAGPLAIHARRDAEKCSPCVCFALRAKTNETHIAYTKLSICRF